MRRRTENKILITGGTGFIGTHVCQLLGKKGFSFRHFKGDVTRIKDWVDQIESGGIVLHMANVKTDSKEDLRVNAGGTENLFKAIDKNGQYPQKVILVSSQSVYLGCKPPFKENMKPKPTTIYGKSRLKAEEYAQKWSKKLKVPLIILRPSGAKGPRINSQGRISGGLIPWSFAGLKSEPIKVFQDGKQTRDYVHISDVSSAIVFAIKNIKEGIYNIGGPKEIQMIDVAKWAKDAIGGKSKIVIVGGSPTPSDPKRLFSDSKKLFKKGWKHKKTARQGVYEFVKDFKKTDSSP